MQPAAATETTADDLAVMSAVLDGFLRADRDRSIRLGRRDEAPRAVFLVLDRTVPACGLRSHETNNPTLACFDVNRDTERRLLNELECTLGLLPIDVALMRRNDTPLAIAGRLGDDVVLVPADTVNSAQSLSALRRKYLPDAVVTFSAPIYPTTNAAVVYYRMFDHGFGFVCLTRSANRWAVRSRQNVVE